MEWCRRAPSAVPAATRSAKTNVGWIALILDDAKATPYAVGVRRSARRGPKNGEQFCAVAVRGLPEPLAGTLRQVPPRPEAPDAATPGRRAVRPGPRSDAVGRPGGPAAGARGCRSRQPHSALCPAAKAAFFSFKASKPVAFLGARRARGYPYRRSLSEKVTGSSINRRVPCRSSQATQQLRPGSLGIVCEFF